VEGVKPLLVDPSSRGGIASYTRLLVKALGAVGVHPVVLGSRVIGDDYVTRSWLPAQRWNRPDHAAAWPRFYAGRASGWLLSAAAVQLAFRLERPDLIHFQAPINRQLDIALLRWLRRIAPVVWTAHDVLPPEPAAGDERRFAMIYRAVDAVIVHGEAAAHDVRRIAGVEALIVDHVPSDVDRIERSEARKQLGLPVPGLILGAIGFVRSHKGYDLLADVWDALGASAPLLLVLGEAVDKDSRLIVDRLARTDRVIVRRGYASENDLQVAASAVDALLLPYVSSSESGLLHLAQGIGLPVFASDAPQLAASVRERQAGRVLPRDVGVWAKAVTGALPPRPARPPSPGAVGQAHVRVYEEALRRARARRLGDRPRGLLA
jgi:glycosyltransferase involved in cell wall biosynthesis